MSNRLLKIGVLGTGITAVCCFTPALAVLLGILGVSSVAGYLDIVLLPALGGFLLMTGYALWRHKRPG